MISKLQGSDYLAANKVQKIYGVSTGTLRNWEKEEKISAIRAPGGKRLYNRESIEKLFHVESKVKERICYARVSSSHQKEDLVRQVELLQTNYPKHRVIQDIGSGLNWKRKGFLEILDGLYGKTIEEVVVLHKDRLCRFGYELVEFIVEKAGAKLLVRDQIETSKEINGEKTIEKSKYISPEQELAEDLLSIVTVFVARNNGKRSGVYKRGRKKAKIESEKNKSEHEEEGKKGQSKRSSFESQENSDGSDRDSEESSQ